MKSGKVASIQMCSTTDLEKNLHQASMLIEKAAKAGAVLAVLPEMFPLFGSNANEKLSIKEPAGHGRIQHFLSSLSLKFNIWLVGGTIPISCQDENKITASVLVFDSKGNQVARYDKIHLFDAVLSDHECYKESDTTEKGSETIVLNSPIGKLGLCVCFDLRFPQLLTALKEKGAEIIAVPAAFTKLTGEAHWELLARCRAIDNFCYIVGACQGGKHDNGRDTHGHSMIVNPWGEIVDEVTLPGPGIAFADINLDYLHEIRKRIPLCG